MGRTKARATEVSLGRMTTTGERARFLCDLFGLVDEACLWLGVMPYN